MRLLPITCLFLLLAGCASTQETNQLRRNIAVTDQELSQFRAEAAQKIAEVRRRMKASENRCLM